MFSKMKHKLIFLIIFTFIVNCSAQVTTCLPIFPEGKLLRTFPYSFSLEDTLGINVTYNGVPVYKYGNQYVVRPIVDGHFKICKVVNDDTLILVSKQLKVVDPPYSVTLNQSQAGFGITKQKVPNAYAIVHIENNDISLALPIQEMTISYQKNKQVTACKIDGGSIPKKIGIDIIKSGSTYLVLDITINLLNQVTLRLPPAIFFVK